MAEPILTTAKYGTIITAIGKEKITAAILAGKQVKVTHAAVGDGGGAYYYPTEDQTDLIGERWSGEIASSTINQTASNMIDVKFIIPADVGGFTIREGKLVDEEGDTIAIWNTPDVQKIVVDDGATFPLTMVAHLVVEDAGAISVTVNPALDTVSREELEEALRAYAAGVGSCIIMEDFIVPIEGWYAHGLTEPGYVDYPYAVDIAVSGCTEKHFPVFSLHLPYHGQADAIGLCPSADTLDGMIRFISKAIPGKQLVGTLQLRSANLMEDVLGGFATDEEAKDEIDDAFGESGAPDGSTGEDGPTEDDIPDGYTVATDEDAMAKINGSFGL